VTSASRSSSFFRAISESFSFFSMRLPADSLSALFSRSFRSSSVVSKASTGVPAATSVPSGANIAILKSYTSGTSGGPTGVLLTAWSTPFTSTVSTRSPRLASAHTLF
jgi:acyl-coenzyme A synthetase/AMP-(fatty) acid ligase